MFAKANRKTDIKMQWSKITPAQAAKVLNHTTATDFPQRPLLDSVSSRYAKEMRDGTWHSHTADVVRLCKWRGGYAVLDGQHRLDGIIKSGEEQNCWVAIDVPESAFKYVDQGAVRGLSHVIAAAGWSSPAVMAQTGRMLYDMDRGVNPLQNKGTGQASGTLFDVIAENYGGIVNLWDKYGTEVNKAAKACFTAKAVVLFSFYVWEREDHDKAVAALTYLANHTDIDPPNNVYKFARERMVENNTHFTNQKHLGTAVRTEVQKFQQAMVLRYAWNSDCGRGGNPTAQMGFNRAFNKWLKDAADVSSWTKY